MSGGKISSIEIDNGYYNIVTVSQQNIRYEIRSWFTPQVGDILTWQGNNQGKWIQGGGQPVDLLMPYIGYASIYK